MSALRPLRISAPRARATQAQLSKSATARATAARDPLGPDRLAPARALIIGLRWGTLAVALPANLSWTPAFSAGFVTLGLVAAFRTFRPLRYRGGRRDAVLLGIDVTVALAVIGATGWWRSPFLFCLAATIVVVGSAWGMGAGTAIAVVVSTGVSAAYQVTAIGPETRELALGTSQLVLVAIVAGYARRLFGNAQERTERALSRVNRLAEANDLLLELYRVAQTIPLSLELGGTLESTTARLRELFQPEVILILLPDEHAVTWEVAVAEGARVPGCLTVAQLPAPLQVASGSFAAQIETDLDAADSVGSRSRSGIYAPLRARGQLLGLIAVEREQADAFTQRDANMIDVMSEQAALAIDNARWFSRLRTVGADEERSRIARELHDRVGQSLAYLAFELDRLTSKSDGLPIHDDLKALGRDVRQTVTDVRETLYDLRTEVDDEHSLEAALSGFLERVGDRSGLAATFHPQVDRRLPLPVERELWRITMEAVTNVERHAHARSVNVGLIVEDDHAVLEVSDDGIGFLDGSAGRADSYGVVGMRERADAVGAILSIDSRPGHGTTVRCRYHPTAQRGAA